MYSAYGTAATAANPSQDSLVASTESGETMMESSNRSNRVWGGVVLGMVTSTFALLAIMARSVSPDIDTAGISVSALHADGLVTDTNALGAPGHPTSVADSSSEQYLDWEALAARVKVGDVSVDEEKNEVCVCENCPSSPDAAHPTSTKRVHAHSRNHISSPPSVPLPSPPPPNPTHPV